jgi:hypothetical protein
VEPNVTEARSADVTQQPPIEETPTPAPEAQVDVPATPDESGGES